MIGVEAHTNAEICNGRAIADFGSSLRGIRRSALRAEHKRPGKTPGLLRTR